MQPQSTNNIVSGAPFQATAPLQTTAPLQANALQKENIQNLQAALAVLKKKQKMTLADGGNYCGFVKNGVPHGKGSCSYPNNVCYKGTYKKGVLKKGTIIRAQNVYKGEIKCNAPHGVGRSTSSNAVLEGRFKNGILREGTSKVSDSVQKGIFRADGTLKQGIIKDRVSISEGSYQNDKLHGPGSFKNETAEYKGMFEEGKLEGQGSFKAANGDFYEGTFKKGAFFNGALTSNGKITQYVKGVIRENPAPKEGQHALWQHMYA